jgi:hypothetical protein
LATRTGYSSSRWPKVAYRAFVLGERAQHAFAEHLARIMAEPVDIPRGLTDRLRDKLAENPRESWDQLLRKIISEDDDNADD